MFSPDTEKLAAEIRGFVVENGRVEGDGLEWLDNLGVEVELEARERGNDSTEANIISQAAVGQAQRASR